MAKLAFTLTALFFLFAFSHARTPSDLPANEIKGRGTPVDNNNNNNLPEPKTTTTTLLLPSERPETEPETVIEGEPETTVDSKLPEPDFAAIESTESNKHGEHVPLTMISFRPINRHFPRRPFPLSFRHGHRCRGGHRWSPRFHGSERERERQIPFGDDMILSGASEDLSLDPVFRSGVRQIPARWVNFRHEAMRFPYRRGDDVERPYHHHRHHHHHDHDGDHHEEDEVEETREHDHEHHDHHEHQDHHEHRHHEGGLMRRFRKFLNHF